MAKTVGSSPDGEAMAQRSTALRGRDTPTVPFEGVLFVDMEGVRAKYECLRPGCPQRLEGPVHSTDRDPTDMHGRPIGAGGVKAFIDCIKNQHLAQHHGSPR